MEKNTANHRYKERISMADIKHKILVLSGKGGVGKSSIAVNLAVWLSLQNKKVGLLDADIHGPSVPKLLALEEQKLVQNENAIVPIQYNENLQVISIGFVLPSSSDAVIWRGPMKHNAINQFINDVGWGELDYLIVDCPPGTGDEPLSVVQVLGNADGAIIVTTPQQLAVTDVKKCITFCRQLNLPVLGVIENMSGFICPHCNRRTNIFSSSGGRKMAAEFGVPFSGAIPLDADMVTSADAGEPFIECGGESTSKQAMEKAFEMIVKKEKMTITREVQSNMRIAIPLTNGKLSVHFGHCEHFAIIDVDEATKEIKGKTLVDPPRHEPGVLPKWLAGMQTNLIIAGGMGKRAQELFRENQIEVLVGAADETPENIVQAYMDNTLQVGDNICDH